MKKLILTIICATIALPLFAQLTQYDIVNIDILVPPDEHVTFGNKDVAIVAVHYYNDSISKHAGGFVNDSLSTNRLANQIKTELEESIIFEDYDIPVYNFYTDKNQLGKSITANTANELYEATDAQMLIVVEAFYINQSEKNMEIVEYGSKRMVSENIFTCWLRIYDMETRNIAKNYYVRDTMFFYNIWTDSPVSVEDAQSKVIKTLSKDFSDNVVPYWETVDRAVYFAPLNKKSVEGYEYAMNQEWDKATTCWTELLDSEKKRNRAIAMYNLALSCEILGKFDLAIQWLEKCKAFELTSIDVDGYIKILNQRIADKKILDEI